MPRYCLYTLPRSALVRIQDEIDTMGLPHRLVRTTNGFVKKMEKKDGIPVFMRPYEITIVLHDDLRLNGFEDFVQDIIKDTMLIVDEFHMAMGNSKRTGIVMELMNFSAHFIGMSATVIRSEDLTPVILWVEQIVDFEVTVKNFWAAMSAMITLFVKLKVVVNNTEKHAVFTKEEASEYRRLMQAKGGPQDFNEVVNICHSACLRDMITKTELLLTTERGVFFIAKNAKMAKHVQNHFLLTMKEEEVYVIGKDTLISIKADDNTPIRLLITTPSYSMGYDATKMTAVVQSVYFVNQSIREQLDGRLVRIGQDREVTFLSLIHI